MAVKQREAVRALLVDPDGSMRLCSMSGELADLNEAVGGYIEVVTGAGWHAYLNEDGRMLGLPPNPRASVLLAALGRPVGPVVGAVVFLGGPGPQEGDVSDAVLDVARALGEVVTG